MRTFFKSHCFQGRTTPKCRGFNRFHTCWNLNRGYRTIRECAIIIRRRITTTDSFQIGAFLESHCCQFGASLECRGFNRFYTCWNLDRSQCRTIRESSIIIRFRIISTDSFQLRPFLKSYCFQRRTTFENTCFNHFYIGRNYNRGYTFREYVFNYLQLWIFPKSHCFQRRIPECSLSNRLYTRRDFNRGQCTTPIKCIDFNCSHPVWYNNIFQLLVCCKHTLSNRCQCIRKNQILNICRFVKCPCR